MADLGYFWEGPSRGGHSSFPFPAFSSLLYPLSFPVYSFASLAFPLILPSPPPNEPPNLSVIRGALQTPQRGLGRNPGFNGISVIFWVKETCLAASTWAKMLYMKLIWLYLTTTGQFAEKMWIVFNWSWKLYQNLETTCTAVVLSVCAGVYADRQWRAKGRRQN